MATTAEKSSAQSPEGAARSGATTPAGVKATGALPKVVGNVPPKTPAPQPSFAQRMLGTLRGSRVSPPAGKLAAKPAKPAPVQQPDRFPPGFWRKRLLGTLLLTVGSFIILFGLEYVGAAYPQLGLLATIAPSKANVPLLSGLSYEIVILLVLLVGLYLLTMRLGLLPNANQPSSSAQQSSTGSGGATQTATGTPGPRKPVNATPGIGERRTRADRRYAAERAAERATRAREAKIARENSGMRGMLNRAFKREAAAENTTTTTKTTTAGAAKTAKAPAMATTQAHSEHDEMYERVKSDQRMRRRREGKR